MGKEHAILIDTSAVQKLITLEHILDAEQSEFYTVAPVYEELSLSGEGNQQKYSKTVEEHEAVCKQIEATYDSDIFGSVLRKVVTAGIKTALSPFIVARILYEATLAPITIDFSDENERIGASFADVLQPYREIAQGFDVQVNIGAERAHFQKDTYRNEPEPIHVDRAGWKEIKKRFKAYDEELQCARLDRDQALEKIEFLKKVNEVYQWFGMSDHRVVSVKTPERLQIAGFITPKALTHRFFATVHTEDAPKHACGAAFSDFCYDAISTVFGKIEYDEEKREQTARYLVAQSLKHFNDARVGNGKSDPTYTSEADINLVAAAYSKGAWHNEKGIYILTRDQDIAVLKQLADGCMEKPKVPVACNIVGLQKSKTVQFDESTIVYN